MFRFLLEDCEFFMNASRKVQGLDFYPDENQVGWRMIESGEKCAAFQIERQELDNPRRNISSEAMFGPQAIRPVNNG